MDNGNLSLSISTPSNVGTHDCKSRWVKSSVNIQYQSKVLTHLIPGLFYILTKFLTFSGLTDLHVLIK
jgi:hypothetical protein